MSKDFMDDDEITIRNYRTSDYEDTVEMLKILHDMFDIGLNLQRWKKSSGLRQFKPNLKRITLIAELKSTGDVIGMGMLEAIKNNLGQYLGYLDNWSTKKKFIGKRVGKILAERAIEILKSWGCESVRINFGYNVDKNLINVVGKIGFKPILIVLEKKFDENNEE